MDRLLAVRTATRAECTAGKDVFVAWVCSGGVEAEDGEHAGV